MDSSPRQQEPQCILCGRCLEVCPLLAATGREELSPRAKLFSLKRLAEAPDELSERAVEDLAELCLACGRCAEVCPQGTDVPATVAKVREKHPGFKGWLWKQWIGRADLLWPLCSRLGEKLPEDAAPGGNLRKLAAMAPTEGLKPWLKPVEFTPCPDASKAVLFSGCLARNARPAWVGKAEALMHKLGIEVGEEPRWDCCGGTLGHAGLAEAEAKAVANNVAAWREAGRPRIVTFCASCAHGLSGAAYKEFEGFEPGEAETWTQALTPLSSLLENVRFDTADNAPDTVHYHSPCHARPADPDHAWLAEALGQRLDSGDGKDCCGLGGIMQLGAPELSSTVAARLWRKRGAKHGATMLSGCSGCLMQLAATAPEGVAVAHWLDVVVED